MEKKNASENKCIKSEEKLNAGEVNTLKCKDQDIQFEKNEFKVQNSVSDANNSINVEEKEKIVKSNEILNSKVVKDGVTAERVLSEGEASSEYETISSLSSKDDIEDFALSSSICGDDFNVIVEIENELAFKNLKDLTDLIKSYQIHQKISKILSDQLWTSIIEESVGKVCYRKVSSNSFYRYKNRSEIFSDSYKSQQNVGFKNFREHKYGHNNKGIDMSYQNSRKDKIPNDKEISHFRWYSPIKHERSRSRSKSRNQSRSRSKSRSENRYRSRIKSRNRSRSKDKSRSWIRKSKWSRENDYELRFKHGRSREGSNGSQSSINLECNVKSKSSSFKDRKTEERLLEDFDQNSAKSYPKRNSESTKRKRSCSSSVWSHLSPNGIKKKYTNKDMMIRNLLKNSRGNKETSFLMKLDRKLKKADFLKDFPKKAANRFTFPVPEHSTVCGNLSLLFSTLMPQGPNIQVFYQFQYAEMPRFSLDNLPLVPGPTGLPVHITMTGEQIVHDMDGRCIPIGPNGHYLPVDPTGRLFPHIISPGNQAVPIHITKDGIIRLPNSEPIPYGPGHQFPVNIDGRVIVIGPDSRPLHPCSNLPREPPPLLQTMESPDAGHVTLQKVKPQAPVKPQISQRDSSDLDSFSNLKCVSESNKDTIEEIVISSNDNPDVLKIVCDYKNKKTQNKQAKKEDPIIKKIHRVLKSLREKNYQPPAFGRFIVTNLVSDPVVKHSPNESPLVRNRIQLPFLISEAREASLKDQPFTAQKTAVTFKFLPQKRSFENVEKPLDSESDKVSIEKHGATKIPASSFDFAMQCDFTSVIIKNLSSKVSDLETELVRLKNVNTSLLDGYRNVQTMYQKKNDLLRKAALEIEKKDHEIQTLKRSLEKRQ